MSFPAIRHAIALAFAAALATSFNPATAIAAAVPKADRAESSPDGVQKGPAGVSKEEKLTCSVVDNNRITIKNVSIYYLLPGAKLYVNYYVTLPGSPNPIKYGAFVVVMKRQIDHDVTFRLAKRLPHDVPVDAGCSAHVRKQDKRVTVGH